MEARPSRICSERAYRWTVSPLVSPGARPPSATGSSDMGSSRTARASTGRRVGSHGWNSSASRPRASPSLRSRGAWSAIPRWCGAGWTGTASSSGRPGTESSLGLPSSAASGSPNCIASVTARPLMSGTGAAPTGALAATPRVLASGAERSSGCSSRKQVVGVRSAAMTVVRPRWRFTTWIRPRSRFTSPYGELRARSREPARKRRNACCCARTVTPRWKPESPRPTTPRGGFEPPRLD